VHYNDSVARCSTLSPLTAAYQPFIGLEPVDWAARRAEQWTYFQGRPNRTYLEVDYHDKEDAKRLGAKWGAQCPRGDALGQGMWFARTCDSAGREPFEKWLPLTTCQPLPQPQQGVLHQVRLHAEKLS
jgi:Domain of unknown function (DUF5710)